VKIGGTGTSLGWRTFALKLYDVLYVLLVGISWVIGKQDLPLVTSPLARLIDSQGDLGTGEGCSASPSSANDAVVAAFCAGTKTRVLSTRYRPHFAMSISLL
jgi:hypothetical protein